MSVLIKDMEMPTSCTMCWLNTFCGVWNTEPAKHKGFNKRLEDCPIAEQILCKDCKNYYPNMEADGEAGDCKKARWFRRLQYPNDYCSRAERKETS